MTQKRKSFTLGELAQAIFVGLPVSRHVTPPSKGTEIRVASVGDIDRECLVSPEALNTVSLCREDVIRFFIRTGDVLVSCRGTILKACVVPPGYEDVVVSSNLMVIRLSHDIDPYVVLVLFRSKTWNNLLRLRSRSSADLLQLTVKDIRELPVPKLSAKNIATIAGLIENSHAYIRHAERAIALRHALITKTCIDLIFSEDNDESN